MLHRHIVRVVADLIATGSRSTLSTNCWPICRPRVGRQMPPEVLPIMAIRGGSERKGYDLFRLQVYERVGILVVEVYERVRKSVILVCERAQRANRWILWLYKVEKTLYFFWLIPIQMTVHLQQLKVLQSFKQGMWRGYYFLIEGWWKRYVFREKWYV